MESVFSRSQSLPLRGEWLLVNAVHSGSAENIRILSMLDFPQSENNLQILLKVKFFTGYWLSLL